MAVPTTSSENELFLTRAVETSIRIGVLGLLVFWCFLIIGPFVVPIVWGIIIAVALYPTFQKAEKLVGGRRKLAATLVTLLMILVLVIPSILLAETLVTGLKNLADGLQDGSLQVPPPPEGVSTWPVIGQPLADLWSLASVNMEKALQQIGPQLQEIGIALLAAAGQTGLALLLFIVSIIIAGVLLANAQAGGRMAENFAIRLVGERGVEHVRMAEATVRSVARGILGTAAIQAMLAGIGLLVAGIPGAGLWALLCLILALMQIGPLPVMLLAAVYMFATADTLPAVLFTVWALVVVASDNVLKPILLGRGVDVPMLVILIGALGGFITSGIIGLFVGAVILALGYRLFMAWLDEGGASPTS
ncbi:MAG: AI-2E family transporter [Bacteroidota bacterium]